MKRVAFFSIGIPDPSQGGAGIFNYLVCSELLRRGARVTAFFRVNEQFVRDHSTKKYLEQFAASGLEYRLIYEQKQGVRFALGRRLLLASHHYDVCKQTVDALGQEINEFDGCLSFDLGWAMALSQVAPPAVRVLGDPLIDRLRFAYRGVPLWRAGWRWIQLRWLEVLYYRALKTMLGEKHLVGMFAPQHVMQLRRNGVACMRFRLSTPEVAPVERTDHQRETLVALHVGSLYTTASRQMMDYWRSEVFSALGDLPFDIEIRFVGRVNEKFSCPNPNIKLCFVGLRESLAEEFENADIFLCPMRYPVGVRTRIVTALSYGIPVIADRSAGFGLVELRDGEEIVYVDGPRDIAQALRMLFESPDLRKKLARNSRAAWEACYHPSKNIGRLLSVFDL